MGDWGRLTFIYMKLGGDFLTPLGGPRLSTTPLELAVINDGYMNYPHRFLRHNRATCPRMDSGFSRFGDPVSMLVRKYNTLITMYNSFLVWRCASAWR